MTDDPNDFAKVIKKVNDTYALVAQLAMSHEMLRSWSHDSFDECIKKIAVSNEEIHTKISGVVDSVKKTTQEIFRFQGEIPTKFRLIGDEVKLLKYEVDQLLTENKDLKTQLQNVDKKIYALHVTTNVALTGNVNKAKSDLEQKINSIPIPQNTVNITQVKDQIEQQIEPTRRDTNTASKNILAHDTRLMLLEKKMGNALAQLKQLERYQ